MDVTSDNAPTASRLPTVPLLVGLLLLYFGASVWMALRLPAQAAPNEWLNYEYIVVMRETGRLPNRGAVNPRLRYNEWHQPPVYFTVAALLGLPWQHPDPSIPFSPYSFVPHSPDAALIDGVPPPLGFDDNPHFTGTPRGNLNPALHIDPASYPTLYAARIAAALFGVVAGIVFFATLRRVTDGTTALLGVSLLLFMPNVLHLSGSVNGDLPLMAVGTIAVAVATLFVAQVRPWWQWIGLGALLALAILTKGNGVYAGAAMVPLLILVWRRDRFARAAISALLTLAGLLPLWGAWLWRNARLTGDAAGVSGSLPLRSVLLQNPLDVRFLAPEFGRIWQSFWLDWTAGDVSYAPAWIYGVGFLFVVALLMLNIGRRQRATHGWLWLAAGGAIAYLYLMVKTLTITSHGLIVPEGRWLLPVWPTVAWFAAQGGRRLGKTATMALAAVLPVSALLLLAWWLPHLYPQATPIADFSAESAPAIYSYDELTLASIDLPTFTTGQLTPVNLYWQVANQPEEDWTVSVQLLTWRDDGWHKLAEHNSYHGLGRNPSSSLTTGHWQDAIWLSPSDVSQPTEAQLLVKLLSETGEVSAVRPDGGTVDFPLVGQVVVRPEAAQMISAETLPAPIQFDEQIELAAVELGSDEVTLWWRTLEDVPSAYQVFVHAVDASGNIVVQSDQPPAQGGSPTTLWRAGDVVADRHRFDQPIDGLTLRIGLYRPDDFSRLSATLNGQPLQDNLYEYAP